VNYCDDAGTTGRRVDGNGGTWTMEISYAGGLMAWTGHADIQHVLVITLMGQFIVIT